MFCEQCGKENPNGIGFCDACGAPLGAIDAEKSTNKLNDTQKRVTIIVVAAVALTILILVVIGIVSCASKSKFTKPMNNIIKALQEEDANLFFESLPEDVEDEIDSGDKKELKEGFKAGNKVLEDEYGENVKIKAKVVSKKKLEKGDIRDLEEEIYGLDKWDPDEVYEVEYKITVKGKDDKEEAKWETYIAKVDDRWCFVELNSFIDLIEEFVDAEDIENEMY